MRMVCTVLVAALLLGVAANGHDFWVQPASFEAQPGEVLKIGLRVGDEFPGESVPRRPDRIEKFVNLGPKGESQVPGLKGQDPAGLVRFESEGLHVIGFRSNNKATSNLAAEDFEAYLREEGLEHVIAERARRKESATAGREIYSRNAKALVAVGAIDREGRDRELGFPVELVVEQNPYALRPGDKLTVRVVAKDRKVEGILLEALHAGNAQPKVAARTDASGRAEFTLREPGQHVIAGVYMERARGNPDADWESFWLSTTFELPRSVLKPKTR